jgi:hypothetical protein
MSPGLFPFYSVADRRYAGRGFVAGIAPGVLTVDGLPARRTIRLIDRGTGRLARQTASADDGSYRFDWVREDPQFWQLVAMDDQSEHNAVIADLITAAPMPE